MKFTYLYPVLSLPFVTLVLPAQEAQWQHALPEKSSELVEKLLGFEEAAREDIARFEASKLAEIEEKRDAVVRILEQTYRRQRAGTDTAKALEHLLSTLRKSSLEEPLRLLPPPAGGVSSEPITDKQFKDFVARLRIESHGNTNVSGNGHVTAYLDGKEIYREGLSGLHLLVFDSTGLRDRFGISDFGTPDDELEKYAEQLEERIERLPENAVAVLAVGVGASRYNDYLRKFTYPLGGGTRSLQLHQSYICIGHLGLRRKEAVEVIGGRGMGESAIFHGEQAPQPPK